MISFVLYILYNVIAFSSKQNFENLHLINRNMRINEDFLDNEKTELMDVQTTSDGVMPEFVVFCNSFINNKKQRTEFINGFGRYVKRLASVYLSDIVSIDITLDDPQEPRNISIRIALLPE